MQSMLGYRQWRRFEDAIKRAMTSCETSGNNPDNHFADERKLKEASKTKEWFRPGQVLQLKKYTPETDPWLCVAIKIMHDCFARPNELRQLKIADINFETKKLRIVYSNV